MLSYQHHYHAGNHADVLKHWLLVECVRYLQKKDKGFDYIDTHAGAGHYPLTSAAALKNAEFKGGVARVVRAPIAGMENYLQLVQTEFERGRYPGSAALVNALLRPQDKSWLFELHPQTHPELLRNCQRNNQTQVRREDGLRGLLALLPVASRRALVLIDPSYEVKDEYQQVVATITQAWRRMPQTVVLLWYPVVDRRRIDTLERALCNSPVRNIQLFELAVRADAEGAGMTASGVIAINPPWTLAEQAQAVLPRLAERLSEDGEPRFRCQRLVDE